jgi:PIN domain nuclease of toxin-antitoxin system
MAVVVDTHTAAWYVTADNRLSATALRALNDAIASGGPILLPSICLVEMTYLVEKRRIPPTVRQALVEQLFQEDSPFELAPLSRLSRCSGPWSRYPESLFRTYRIA